ncbi:MAG: Y-family DNA polymerase [Bacteroidota bacterium]|nr:Y-family DNA polymerase [Bacteroidota bacterium]
MRAIVDCNSFYCSCERLFQPHLANKPVVVLSNNDGCIISRTDEAKQLGIEMAGPYFMAKPLIEKYGVTTFSSNYTLYGDLSWRVMETLRKLLPPGTVEVYSVDESFLDVSHIPVKELTDFSRYLRETIEQWTGIQVSIGVAPTKVLSKIANRLSKKNKAATHCVLVLDTPKKIEQALERTPIGDVWGIGRQYAEKLRNMQLFTARDLSLQDPSWGNKYLGGVTGARLIRELRGIESIQMQEALVTKKMIATTRMFGSQVTEIKDIREAVATYISRAAEKLRRQKSAASTLYVFVVPKEPSTPDKFRHGSSVGGYTNLPVATSLTQELIKPGMELVEKLFEKGRIYKKAGVILSGIVPENTIQGNLFHAPAENKNQRLMHMIDNVNFAMRDDILKFASSGTTRNWKMRQELRSPRYTTRWDELYAVK